MNLTDTLTILNRHNLDYLKISKSPHSNVQLVNLNKFRQVYFAVRDLPGLKTAALELEGSDAVKSSGDYLSVPDSEVNGIVNASYRLSTAAKTLHEALKEIVPPLSNGSIRVKMPDPSDYRGLLQDQETLAKACGFIIFSEGHVSEMRISGWENGSFWLTLYLGGPAVVSLVAAAVWSAAVIRKKWIEGDILKEKVKESGAEASFLDHISQKAKIAADLLVDAEATALYDSHGQGGNKNEQIGRNKEALILFAELMRKGAEVHPALIEPEIAANVFPNYSALDTITSKIPLLKDLPKAEDVPKLK